MFSVVTMDAENIGISWNICLVIVLIFCGVNDFLLPHLRFGLILKSGFLNNWIVVTFRFHKSCPSLSVVKFTVSLEIQGQSKFIELPQPFETTVFKTYPFYIINLFYQKYSYTAQFHIHPNCIISPKNTCYNIAMLHNNVPTTSLIIPRTFYQNQSIKQFLEYSLC